MTASRSKNTNLTFQSGTRC